MTKEGGSTNQSEGQDKGGQILPFGMSLLKWPPNMSEMSGISHLFFLNHNYIYGNGFSRWCSFFVPVVGVGHALTNFDRQVISNLAFSDESETSERAMFLYSNF